MAALAPTDRSRRSFVYRTLAAAGARFVEQDGAAVANDFGAAPAAEAAAARGLGLADLSPLARSGFKGRGALDWLAAQGVAGLDRDNRATRQPDGALAARLAPTEALLLSDLRSRGDLVARLDAAWSPESAPACYPVLRRDASFWFAVSGRHSAAMFAKICGVDLRPDRFPDGAVAQTSVARTNAIIIRHDLGPVTAFATLGDSASAAYLWDCLVDAMAEFDGRPVGLAALHLLIEG